MNIKIDMIEFPSNGQTTPAYLARPDDALSHPAVIVIQEWWGLVPHIKEMAERFSAEGYIALAPDLYHGQAAEEPDEARKLAMALDRDKAVAEITAAARYLATLPETQPKRVGVVGWCMGGGLSLSAAAENGAIGAAVCFYGRPLDESDTARLQAPVLGHFASEDQGIPVADVRAFEQELERHDVPHQIHVYEGAHHAFFNNTRPVYDPQAAADAWRRTLSWFGRYLSG
ncbi:MAG TPA: dienelactone hydrolase family protein [Anaerolineae bacterium]|nr:dienelactone hydrolase family protein [Anaerolineae bacterium]